MLRTNTSNYVKNANQLYLLIAAVMIFLLPQQARADQILEIHDGSLTNYLPTSASGIQGMQATFDFRGPGVDGLEVTPNVNCFSTPDDTVYPATFPPGGGFGGRSLSNVDLFTGTFSASATDLSFPAAVPVNYHSRSSVWLNSI